MTGKYFLNFGSSYTKFRHAKCKKSALERNKCSRKITDNDLVNEDLVNINFITEMHARKKETNKKTLLNVDQVFLQAYS